ncbi:MAG: NUDIX hydrolase [Candidatus Paceibacterota bacterium]|jgi:ADP-ribose pyrophosphatase YjhB (NUDIX family)
MSKEFLIRCRAVIFYKDKILVVKHRESDNFYVLPGGHVEWGEDIKESMRREIVEELGVEPQFGKLLYINNFKEETQQSIEFFFEITNGKDFINTENLGGTHKFELVDICWMGKNDDKKILPKQIQEYLNAGTIISDTVRFL